MITSPGSRKPAGSKKPCDSVCFVIVLLFSPFHFNDQRLCAHIGNSSTVESGPYFRAFPVMKSRKSGYDGWTGGMLADALGS